MRTGLIVRVDAVISSLSVLLTLGFHKMVIKFGVFLGVITPIHLKEDAVRLLIIYGLLE